MARIVRGRTGPCQPGDVGRAPPRSPSSCRRRSAPARPVRSVLRSPRRGRALSEATADREPRSRLRRPARGHDELGYVGGRRGGAWRPGGMRWPTAWELAELRISTPTIARVRDVREGVLLTCRATTSRCGRGSRPTRRHVRITRVVRRPAGRSRRVQDHGHLAEVRRAEDAGRDDRQRSRVGVERVRELVHGAARDHEHVAGPDLDLPAVDRPGEDALQAVDRLLVAVVAVGGREIRGGRDIELEHRHRPARLLRLDAEPDRDRADPDRLVRHRRHHARLSRGGKVI